MTALLAAAVAILIFASGVFVGAICMASALAEIERD